MTNTTSLSTPGSRVGTDFTALTWCVDEIRSSLRQASSSLRNALESGSLDDPEPIRSAASALSQALGALRFAELNEVAQVLVQAEQLIVETDLGQRRLDAACILAIEGALAAVSEWLRVAVQGGAVSAMVLFAHYRELKLLRGQDDADLGDLFDRPLVRSVPEGLALKTVSADQAAALQGVFERGLLGFLRNPGDASALEAMRDALQRLAQDPSSQALRDLWWLAAAVLDALRCGALQADLGVKRQITQVADRLRKHLRARIQNRLTGEPSSVPAAAWAVDPEWMRLQRDLLFLIARSSPGSPIADALRVDNCLEACIPDHLEGPRFDLTDPRAREQAIQAIELARSCWETICAGGRHELGVFGSALQRLDAALARLPYAGLQSLSEGLLGLRRRLGDRPTPGSETLALEAAVCLLFIDMALQDTGDPVQDLDARCALMRQRIDVLPGDGSAIGPWPEWLHQLARAVQGASTRSAFVAALQCNLKGCEQILEGYFQEPSRHGGLDVAQSQLLQSAGALRALGHDEAALALQSLAQQIEAFTDTDRPIDATQCDRMAVQLGSLGLFADSLQRPDRIAAAPSYRAQPDHEGGMPSVLPVSDRLVSTLLPGFIDEAHQQLGLLENQTPDRLSVGPGHAALMRTLHTLKGSARTVGAMGIGQRLHELESRLVSTSGATLASSDLSLTEVSVELRDIGQQITALAEPPDLWVKVPRALLEQLIRQLQTIPVTEPLRSTCDALQKCMDRWDCDPHGAAVDRGAVSCLADVIARLRQVIQQAAQDAGRPSQLSIEGEYIPLPRFQLDRLLGPLEHVLRNAIAHGIEDASERLASGKPEAGCIRLRVESLGDMLSVEVSDDGRGPDFERIRIRAQDPGSTDIAAAVAPDMAPDIRVDIAQETTPDPVAVSRRSGMTDPTQAWPLIDGVCIDPALGLAQAALLRRLFQPGFTTLDQATALAGRGLGLDVVRAEVLALGGHILVSARPGQGLSLTIRLPRSFS